MKFTEMIHGTAERYKTYETVGFDDDSKTCDDSCRADPDMTIWKNDFNIEGVEEYELRRKRKKSRGKKAHKCCKHAEKQLSLEEIVRINSLHFAMVQQGRTLMRPQAGSPQIRSIVKIAKRREDHAGK